MFRKLMFTVIFTLCTPKSEAYGRLIKPSPRGMSKGTGLELATWEQNVPSGLAVPPYGETFVCRDTKAQPQLMPVIAGFPVVLEWLFTTPHVGDCAIYLSTEVRESTRDSELKWYKLAEFPNCHELAETELSITIPQWTQNCEHCILRWEMTALHLWPDNIELYSQCVDVVVYGGSDFDPMPRPIFSIPSSRHLPVTEIDLQYRDVWKQDSRFFVTGPAVANFTYHLHKRQSTADELVNKYWVLVGLCAMAVLGCFLACISIRKKLLKQQNSQAGGSTAAV